MEGYTECAYVRFSLATCRFLGSSFANKVLAMIVEQVAPFSQCLNITISRIIDELRKLHIPRTHWVDVLFRQHDLKRSHNVSIMFSTFYTSQSMHARTLKRAIASSEENSVICEATAGSSSSFSSAFLACNSSFCHSSSSSSSSAA